jgi:outer membrane protein OmpA-like peptidoglycan-associated protein
MRRLTYILFLMVLVSCAGVQAAGNSKEYTCPAPLTIPVEKPVVIAPIVPVVPPPVAKVEPRLEIIPFYFDFDKSDVKGQERTIERAVTILNKDKAKTAELQGNCDQKGSVAYNNRLGLKRAQQVKQILIDKGIEAKRLSTVSFGKKYASGYDSGDRRVDIAVK